MYNQPYFIPSYYSSMAAPSMMRGAMGIGGAMNGAMNGAMMRGAGAAAGAGRGLGLFSRLGSGFSALRSLNWGGFINNASKTLGVINQTIPLVRQVGPMMNNMKSMLRVASIFKDETDKKPTRRKSSTSSNGRSSSNSSPYRTNSYYTSSNSNDRNLASHSSTSYTDSNQEDFKEEDISDSSPTFFIAS